jgi:hypothetical protein
LEYGCKAGLVRLPRKELFREPFESAQGRRKVNPAAVSALIVADGSHIDLQGRCGSGSSDNRLRSYTYQFEARVKQRDFDALSATATLTSYQGRDNAVSCDESCVIGCERQSGVDGSSPFLKYPTKLGGS